MREIPEAWHEAASAPDAKRQSLANIYRAMETAEIERRLKDGRLTELAKEAAQEELAHRQAGGSPKGSQPRTSTSTARMLFATAVFSLVVLLVSHWLLSRELFVLVAITIVMPTVATVMGKAFPTLGLLLGGVLIVTPLWLAPWMWISGALRIQGGDFKPLEGILGWAALFVISVVAMGTGGFLLNGALHDGTWEEFQDELHKKREKATDKLRKLD